MKKRNLLKKVSLSIAAVSVLLAAMVSTGKVFHEAPGPGATANDARSKQAASPVRPAREEAHPDAPASFKSVT